MISTHSQNNFTSTKLNNAKKRLGISLNKLPIQNNIQNNSTTIQSNSTNNNLPNNNIESKKKISR